MKKLKGAMVVMVTPFTESGEVDEKGFRKNIDWYISEGIHGVICTGSIANLPTSPLMNSRKSSTLR